ncbi:uncharacterized protein [Neodiprion pinetum]|uniref:uncharacterized protein n=1 Tax=Neodiprion pinetum TaxID=441929 RepID=UPI00371575D1
MTGVQKLQTTTGALVKGQADIVMQMNVWKEKHDALEKSLQEEKERTRILERKPKYPWKQQKLNLYLALVQSRRFFVSDDLSKGERTQRKKLKDLCIALKGAGFTATTRKDGVSINGKLCDKVEAEKILEKTKKPVAEGYESDGSTTSQISTSSRKRERENASVSPKLRHTEKRFKSRPVQSTKPLEANDLKQTDNDPNKSDIQNIDETQNVTLTPSGDESRSQH